MLYAILYATAYAVVLLAITAVEPALQIVSCVANHRDLSDLAVESVAGIDMVFS